MGSKDELFVLVLSSQIMTRRKDQKGKKCVTEINDISEHQQETMLHTCRNYIYFFETGNVVFPRLRKATHHLLWI